MRSGLLSIPQLLSAAAEFAAFEKWDFGSRRLSLSALLVSPQGFIQLAETLLFLLILSLIHI